MIANQPSPANPSRTLLSPPSSHASLSRMNALARRSTSATNPARPPPSTPSTSRSSASISSKRADFPPPAHERHPRRHRPFLPSPRPRPREPASLAAAGTAPPLPPIPVPPARKTPRRDVRRRRRTPRPRRRHRATRRANLFERLRVHVRVRAYRRVRRATKRLGMCPRADDGSPRRARPGGRPRREAASTTTPRASREAPTRARGTS